MERIFDLDGPSGTSSMKMSEIPKISFLSNSPGVDIIYFVTGNRFEMHSLTKRAKDNC